MSEPVPNLSNLSSTQPEKPIYTLLPFNEIKTVPRLWQEWKYGINGGPSILSLNDIYGTHWRSSPIARKSYSRRLVIIEEIQRKIAELGENDGVSFVEAIRQKNRPQTMNSLYETLKKKKRVGEAIACE
jgi:hypothetical protein